MEKGGRKWCGEREREKNEIDRVFPQVYPCEGTLIVY